MQTDIATIAVSATAITIGGAVTGLDYTILLAGFFGGLGSLSFAQGMGVWRRIWTPIMSAVTAGYAAPTITQYLDFPDATVLFTAWAIGLMAQSVLPLAMSALTNKARSKLNGQ